MTDLTDAGCSKIAQDERRIKMMSLWNEAEQNNARRQKLDHAYVWAL